jgi:hypothetical protein
VDRDFAPERLPEGWPTADDRRNLPTIEDECLTDGIADTFHQTMARVYREKQKPVAGAVHWGSRTVTLAIECESGRWFSTQRLFVPVAL